MSCACKPAFAKVNQEYAPRRVFKLQYSATLQAKKSGDGNGHFVSLAMSSSVLEKRGYWAACDLRAAFDVHVTPF